MGLRDASTPPERFRQLSKTLSMLLVLEATRDIETESAEVRTPMGMAAGRLVREALVMIPILRAGLGMLDPALELFPEVSVGTIGLERHERTAVARSYYSRLPALDGKFAICLDPMLATGGSASQAISLIKAQQPKRIAMVCVVAAPEGVQRLTADHPEVPIFAAAIDERLDTSHFIVPGLGDYGDRLFGTT